MFETRKEAVSLRLAMRWRLAGAAAAFVILLPMLVALPAAVLEGRGVFGALTRSWRFVREGGAPVMFRLIGWVLLPGLIGPSLWLESGPAAAVAGLAGMVVALASVAVQGAGLGVTFIAATTRPGAADGLQRATPRTARARAAMVAALLLPGASYGVVLTANPFGWRQITEDPGWRIADRLRVGQDPPAGWREEIDTRRQLAHRWIPRGVPYWGKNDLELIIGADGLPVLIPHSALGSIGWTACRDRACRSAYSAVRNLNDTLHGVLRVGARLSAGHIVAARPSDDKGRELHTGVRLWSCTPGPTATCASTGPLTYTPGADYHTNVAIDVRPDGSVVLVLLHFADPGPEQSKRGARLTLVTCRDTSCHAPEVREMARLPELTAVNLAASSLQVAVAPGGQLAAVVAGLQHGAISVVSCRLPSCRDPLVTQPVRQAAAPRDAPGVSFVEMSIRDDGRPYLLSFRRGERAMRLHDCRTPDCARVDSTALPALTTTMRESDPARLVVDGAGRALIAGYNPASEHLELSTCEGGRCLTERVTRSRKQPDALALALDPAGRPVILWDGTLAGYVQLTTVLAPRRKN
ncbi:MAG: hypothetical protein HOV83_06815 [Catenulispora sp.]|nr:hypothetical protein [Catenulispora sp.]